MIAQNCGGSLTAAWVIVSREGESLNERPRTEVQWKPQYLMINIKYLVMNPPIPKHDIASLWNDLKHKHPS